MLRMRMRWPFLVCSVMAIATTALAVPHGHRLFSPPTPVPERRLTVAAAAAACDPSQYIPWSNTTVPNDFPLPLSSDLSAYVYAPECASNYGNADTWFVSWAADDIIYSGFTDGVVANVSSGSGAQHTFATTTTGHVTLTGSDPLNLVIGNVGTFAVSTGPWHSRYPAANAHINGVWYQSTYSLDDLSGPCQNWCVQGPFVSFRYSLDQGGSWNEFILSPLNDTDNLFHQTSVNRTKIKFGALHFVDFGQNQQWSPDGYVYLVGHGSNSSFPADQQTTFPAETWNEGDQVYLCRVKPSIQNMNNLAAFEFWSGNTLGWVSGVKGGVNYAEPLFTFPNKTGTTTVSYIPALQKYIMVVSTATYPGIGSMSREFDIYLLEADALEGPWLLIEYLNKFGPQAYFPVIPTKFIGKTTDIIIRTDGSSLWPFFLGYSANFAFHEYANPPHSGYSWCLLSSKLLVSAQHTKRLIERGILSSTMVKDKLSLS